jgi:hypothetical protein
MKKDDFFLLVDYKYINMLYPNPTIEGTVNAS